MQLGWRCRCSHPLQRCGNPAQIVTHGARIRLGLQATIEFGARSCIEFGIDLGMDQFEGAFVDHLRGAPWLPRHRATPGAP